MDLNEFLETLSELVKHGFISKEEVYPEAVRKAREIGTKHSRIHASLIKQVHPRGTTHLNFTVRVL